MCCLCLVMDCQQYTSRLKSYFIYFDDKLSVSLKLNGWCENETCHDCIIELEQQEPPLW